MKASHLRCLPSIAALLLCVTLVGCATISPPTSREPDDPLETANRVVFDTSTALDDALIKPIAESYRKIVPEFLRDRIRAAIDNLTEPRVFANDVLQRRPDAAGITFARFFINTIVGLAGMFDLATKQGFPKQSGDFGQTLYTWGVDDGPYLVLLFFGPSNVRDAFGLAVDLFTPPVLVVTGHAGTMTNVAVGAVDGIDLRARNIETLDEIKASALDFYANLKSLTRQRRAAELRAAPGGTEAPVALLDPGAPLRDNPK